MPTFVEPRSLCMRQQICDYCKNQSITNICAYDRLHGIQVCDNHVEFGKRDVNAHFHEAGIIKLEEFIKRFPIFDNASFTIKRSDGSFTDGCTPYLSRFDATTFVRKSETHIWCIPLQWTSSQNGSQMSKNVPIESLRGQGDLERRDIENITHILDNGFYKADFDARALAGNQKEYSEIEGVYTAYAEGLGPCRVYVPPNAEMP